MHQDDDEYSVENKDEELSLLSSICGFRPDDERRFMPWLAVLASGQIPIVSCIVG